MVLAVFILALNLQFQAMVILDRQKSRRKILQFAIVCAVLGIVCIAFGVFSLARFTIFGWSWITMGTICIISIAIALFVQYLEIGKAEGDRKEFGQKLYTCTDGLVKATIVIIFLCVFIWACLIMFRYGSVLE